MKPFAMKCSMLTLQMVQCSMFKLLLLLPMIGLYSTSVDAQTSHPLLERLRARMGQVKKYEADLDIKIDVPFLKAPPSKAHITFTAPDKTKIDAPGFAMIPKQGADISAQKMLAQPHNAIDAGTEVMQGVAMRKVKVIPIDDKAEYVVATIWIDTTYMVPRKVVTTTRAGGTATAELVYDNVTARQFCLPSYVKLMFDVSEFKIPKSVSGDFDAPSASTKSAGEKQKAIVEIWYSNYKIK